MKLNRKQGKHYLLSLHTKFQDSLSCHFHASKPFWESSVWLSPDTSKGESLQGRRKHKDLTVDYENLISADLQIYRMFLEDLYYSLLWNKKQSSNLKCKLVIWSAPWNKVERSTGEEISVQKPQKVFCFNFLAHQAVYELTSVRVLYFKM